MSTHPYIPLYVDDYDAHTGHLTIEEDGAYSRLIRLCWRTPGCSLPIDHTWIARKIRVSAEDFARFVAPVLEEFFTVQRGRLVQKRLKREYDNISRKKTARKLAGKKGGEAKARNTHEKPASNATVLSPHAGASPEPEPKPEIEVSEAKASSPRAAPSSGFTEFWAAYPNKTGKLAAEKAFAAALKRVTGPDPPSVLLAGVERAKASRAWGEGFIPHPTTWLKQGRWEDEPAEIIPITGRPHERPHPNSPDAKRAAREANDARADLGAYVAAGQRFQP